MNNFRHTGSNKEATLNTRTLFYTQKYACMCTNIHTVTYTHKHNALSSNYTFNAKATMLDTPEQKAKLKTQNKSLVHSWNVKKSIIQS